MNNTFMIDRLIRQKEEIDNLIKNYQGVSQQPVNNFINATPNQIPAKDMIEWRILNESEEVDNLYVQNKTLFMSDNLMILKGVDGSLTKWKIQKIYPVDKKDEKINQLEGRIKELEEMIKNEYKQPTSANGEFKQSDELTNVGIESKPKNGTKSISKQDKPGTSRSNSENV